MHVSSRLTNAVIKLAASAAADLTKGSQWVYYHSENTQWVQSITHTHTHPFNAVSLWCANSHAYYITGLLLPGLTPLTNPCTLCCTWAIYILHPRQGWSEIPLQSIIHWETFQNREGSGFGCTGIDQGANNKYCPLAMQQPVCPQWYRIWRRAGNV